jgi:lipopolysaccharide export system permease protein
MIRQVDRLVAGAVLSALGVAWLVLVGLDLFSVLARDAAGMGKGGVGIGGLLLQAAWTAPRRAYELFPTAALMGSLLGLGSLAASSELVALRAAGLSKLRICLSVLACVAALTAAVVAVGETLGPYGEQRAQALAVSARSPDLALARWSGLWAREGDTFLNARSGVARGGDEAPEIRLDDVRLYEFDGGGRLETVSLAANAHHRGDHWELQDVRRVRFTDAGVESDVVARMQWASQLDPRLLSLSVIRPRYMAADDLLRNLDYLKRNELDATAFEAALWGRVFYPLNVLALTLCALPFAFGSQRSGGLGRGLFFGVVLGVGFWLLQRAFVNMAEVYALDMMSANAMPGLLLLLTATFWLRRSA